MSLLAEDIASLSPAQRKLLELALKKKGIQLGKYQITPRSEQRPHYPLSIAQQRMWFLHQLQPDNTAYHISSPLRFAGPLDVGALHRAFAALVERHETLRSTFPEIDEQPAQVIGEVGESVLPLVDLSRLEAARREAEAQRLVDEMAKRPYDLARETGLRAALLRHAPEVCTLALTQHHIISDGWSMGIFYRELLTLYEAFSAGEPSPLPPLPIQYVDFALWQQNYLQGEVLEKQVSYWQHKLADLPPLVDLPTDRPRQAILSFRGGAVPLAVPPPLTGALREMARRERSTLFAVLLAGWKAVLSRSGVGTDVVVGSPNAARNRQEIEGLIGFFINMMVLRTDLAGDPSFGELMQRVQTTNQEANAHQDLPFEKLVDELQLDRSLNHSPVFQITFAFQPQPGGDLELKNLRAYRQGTGNAAAMFELMSTLTDQGEVVAGVLSYNADLYDRTTIERLGRRFRTYLAGAAAVPEKALSTLPLLAASEHHQLLTEWNDTLRERHLDSSMQALFEARAALRPEAVAVVTAEEELTYGELDRRANQLARRLRELGVVPGRFVGVHLERSAEMVTALLGILKAGGAYAPIEVNLPPARVQWILAHLDVRWLLTQSQRLPFLAEAVGELPLLEHVLCLDEAATEAAEPLAGRVRVWSRPELDAGEDSSVASVTDPGDIAYIIFTSGSTGTPKGVVVRHDPVLNLIEWLNRLFEMGPEDRVLFITSLSFDLSVYDVFGLLAAGGSIRVASREDVQDPQRLVRILVEEPITYWDSAPAALQQLVAFLPQHAPAGNRLRLVFNSGDWIPVTLPGRMASTFPKARMISLGGATEATVWSNYFPIERVEPWWVSIPYGRPIENAAYHVLDDQLEPCPIGVPGDLFIGGECLASGYSDLVLTAQKFIPDPYTGTPGNRLYRTGDRARYWADGNLEFLGRLDHQVKIRGFRIELGEIETVLGEHPELREVAVLARVGDAGHKRLVAYVVPTGGVAPPARDLRTYLGERLPEYMVPSAFVVLEAMPVTANGKLDRKGLPAPEESTATREDDYVAPRTGTEEQLADIWRAVLRVEKVGIHDNFFDLGGDSIISIQIVARSSKGGLKLTPRQVFQHQTIAELATVAGSGEVIEAEQGLVTGPVILTPAQHWFFEQGISNPHHFNQSVLLRMLEPLDPGRVERTLEVLSAHHDALRLRFEPGEDGGWQQRCVGMEESPPSMVVVDLAPLEKEDLQRAIEGVTERLQRSIDLTRGPLLRLALFDLGRGRYGRLFIVAHHLAIDGVSWRILLDDLETVHGQLSRGETPQLPPKTSSFQQWGERLQELTRSGALDEEQTYWLDERRTAVVPLPLDDPAAENSLDSVERVSMALEVNETRALLQDVPKAYRTQINDVLLAALVEIFAEWTGSPHLLLELEGHGREEEIVPDVDLSLTIGWFTALYPLLLTRPEGGGEGDLLKSVKEQLRGVPNRGVGYGLLRYLADEEELRRRLAGLPQPEVSFNYLGQLDQAVSEASRFVRAPESPGPNTGGDHPRRYKLEVNSSVSSGRLSVSWTFSSNLHERRTIERLAEGFLGALKRLIEHCREPGAKGFTPSDFPLAEVDQATLDGLIEDGVEIEDIYPLGPTQHGLLFFHLYAPHSEAYFQQYRCYFSGDLDVTAFKQAWQGLLDHHAALRSSFLWQGVETPLQIVHRRAEVPWIEEDWRDMPEEEQTLRLDIVRQADRARNLDLSQAPVMRIYLIRLRDDTYYFAWSYHHVLLDGWCLPILTQECMISYYTHHQGVRFEPQPVRPYRDYISWLQEQDPGEAEAFWRETLRGFDKPTQLPVDRDPGALPSQEGAYRNEVTWLPAETLQRLEETSQRNKLTINTMVQGAWAMLLSHYSGDRDVVFGVVSSGRPPQLEGVERMIGLFITTLPIRAWIEPEMGLVPWLQKLQDQQLQARQYEYCPLVQVQEWSELSGDQPLFDSIEIFENYPTKNVDEAPQLEGADEKEHEEIPAEPEPAAAAESEVPAEGEGPPSGYLTISNRRLTERPSYPMAVIIGRSDDRLFLTLGHDRERFDDATVQRMVRQLAQMMRGMMEHPEQRLFELSPLTRGERQQMLVDWNDSGLDVPVERTFIELFAAQVERSPEAPAAACEGRQLTYRELDARARSLAGHLRGAGVGPETVVALLADRSLDFLTAMLAVWQAGGAYLPLDPLHPPGRLARVLKLSGVPLALVAEGYRELFGAALGKLPEEARPAVLGLEERLARPAADDAALPVAAGPENLAYVIFTSGSTGVPKGAMLEQRGMVNHLYAKIDELGITAADAVAQTASQCFDISVWQFLSAALVGGRVEIFPDRVAHDPPELIAAVEARGVTILETVPSLMRLQLEEIERRSERPPLATLRWLVPTGEALPPELCRQWLAAYPEIPLLNAYGPTECSDDVTHHALRHAPAPEVLRAPIGRPVANLQLYVVDGWYELRGVEVPGELTVGGIGVGRGYLGDARRTAEVFVPDPFAAAPGQRLYRTGDLACLLPDGTIDFLGRIDHQVKIRGFRIELGEIESVLGEHPGLAQVVVHVWSDERGEDRLVAWAVAAAQPAPAVRALREHVAESLPEYMVPSFVVFLDEIPLTPNGKVDRKALPAPDQTQEVAEEVFVAPRGELESELTGLWEEILDVRPIGVHQDFFDLGGHSLLAIRLMTRIRETFGLHLPLATIFEAGTVAELAEVVRAGEAARRRALVPIQPSGERPFFCVHPVGGNVLCYAELSRALPGEQPFYGLQRPELEILGREAGVEEQAACYLEAIRAVQPEGPYRLGGWSMGGLVAYEMARLLEAEGAAVERLAVIDVPASRGGAAGTAPDDAQLIALFATDLGGLLGQRIQVPVEELRTLPKEALFPQVFEMAKSAGVLPAEMGFEEAELLFELFKSNQLAMRRYETPPYGGSLVLLRGAESLADAPDPTLGWGELAAGGVEVVTVPGTHYGMVRPPHVAELAAALGRVLG